MGEETARATRSLSICAPSASMEALAEAAPRRRPAARSQSARLTGARSVRRRPPPQLEREQRARYSSEPRLAEAETPPAVRRQASARRRPPAHNPAHRKSAAFLDVPRAPPPQDEEPDEDSYRLRTFNVNHKGGIVNRGDSFRRRRSRSGSLAPAAEPPPEPRRPPAHRVAVLGAPGVGKTAIISQFQTSECINAYDGQRGDTDEQKVSIMLNGEESDMVFINVENYKEEVECADPPPDAFMVVYSVVDKASFQRAEQELARLTDLELLRPRPALLVANKIDLARSRAVSTQDGKCLACTYKAKFIEVSVGINHNVDELLVGVLNQIRLKKELFGSEDSTRESSPAHWYKSRGVVRASMKARQMLTWIFGKEDSKFKNCENLHVL